jgi:murein DD-endopeptidase MepM/ murein hydrolase activator NlpD
MKVLSGVLMLGAAIVAAAASAPALTATAATSPGSTSPQSTAPDYSLRGDWRQGALLIGKTRPGTKIWFDDRPLRVSPQGDFVFGLDRDAKPDAVLRVQPIGGAIRTEHFAVAPRAWDIQRIDGLPPDKVNPPPVAEGRIEAEARLINAAHALDTPISDFTETFDWPVRGRISEVFGGQRILNGVPKQPHYGVDVAVPIGTPVHASAGGIVSLAQPDLYFTGGTVIIDHGHGVSTIVVHLSKVRVHVGQQVQRGQLIAESGMTGRATGPHVHWGLYWFGSHLDPQQLVAAQ